MAVLSGMAITSIKSTCSLDLNSVRTLEALTRLQDTVRERGVDLGRWERDLAAERTAAGLRLRFDSE